MKIRVWLKYFVHDCSTLNGQKFGRFYLVAEFDELRPNLK